MALKYHQQTFDLLGLEPRSSQVAIALLFQTEQDCGFAFPPSVKEWYSLENAVDMLLANSNDDHFISVADLGRKNRVDSDWWSEGLLWFAAENQGVCYWAVKLDGADDPGVLVKLDREPTWQLCASHFSKFVWSLVFDWGEKNMYCLCAQAEPLRVDDLSRLRSNFHEGPATFSWPGKENHRFSDEGMRILIWSNPGQADWRLSAKTSESLFELTKRVWVCSNLSRALYGRDQVGKDVLKQLEAIT